MDLKQHKIRIKLTGNCNKSCFFCHQEGGMENILDIKNDKFFQECIKKLSRELNIKEVSLTGGEPTLNKDLLAVSNFLKEQGFRIKITTNGTIKKDWNKYPFDKVTISIHSLSPDKINKIENKERDIRWCKNCIKNNIENIKAITNTDIDLRINIVANNDNLLKEIKGLKKLNENMEIRILDNLNKTKKSQEIIKNTLEEINANKIKEYKRKASSSHTSYYNTDIGTIATKISYPYYFDYLCNKCPIKEKCKEGFYGLRLEKRKNGYYIRLCLYRNDKETLIPYKEFIKSKTAKEYLKLNE